MKGVLNLGDLKEVVTAAMLALGLARTFVVLVGQLGVEEADMTKEEICGSVKTDEVLTDLVAEMRESIEVVPHHLLQENEEEERGMVEVVWVEVVAETMLGEWAT